MFTGASRSLLQLRRPNCPGRSCQFAAEARPPSVAPFDEPVRDQQRYKRRGKMFSRLRVGTHKRPPNGAEPMMPEAVNLTRKLSLFDEWWSPRIVASFNGTTSWW